MQPPEFKSLRHEERKAWRRRQLTEAERRRVVSAYAEDGISAEALATRFGVNACTIREVVRGLKRGSGL